MIIALKKDGRAIPKTEKYKIILSIHESLLRAENTPKINPKINPKTMANNASKKVFGKVFIIIDETLKFDFTNDVLK
tara:strand:+ start:553 stop:783 length:231 start_codon:yes stop_codon:yes gene_type:complete